MIKEEYEYQILGSYGYGMELLSTYKTKEQALEDIKAYRLNDSMVTGLVIKKKRVLK